MNPNVLTLTIVLVGDFAPAMFHPMWFEKHGLIGKQAAENIISKGKLLVTAAQTSFSLEGIEVNVVADKIQIGTNREDLHQPLIDLVSSTLGLLAQTPVRAMGFNWSIVYRAKSTQRWHAFGHRLAPKNFWLDNWGGEPGLAALQIQLDRKDTNSGSVNISVSPVDSKNAGVLIKVNDHYDLKDYDGEKSENFLRENWPPAKAIATDLIDPLKLELERD